MVTSIGLDIGSSAVRAVQLSGGRGPVSLERLGQVELPPGAVRDGEIVKPDQVVEALRALWRHHRLRGRRVAIGVANQQVVVRTAELPAEDERQLRDSLTFLVQDLIPIPVEQAELDVEVIGSHVTDDGTVVQEAVVVAAASDMVQSHLDVLDAAKLQPTVLDLQAFALLRALVDPEDPGADDEGEMLVDVGATVTNVVVHHAGVPRFVRILLLGGAAITESLIATSDLTWDEAEALKADPDRPAADPRSELISDRAERFITEIRGSLDYYRAQADAIRISRVVLSGGGSLLPGLAARLADALGLPVDRGHPMQSVRIGKVPLTTDQLAEAEPFVGVAIGLAMGALE